MLSSLKRINASATKEVSFRRHYSSWPPGSTCRSPEAHVWRPQHSACTACDIWGWPSTMRLRRWCPPPRVGGGLRRRRCPSLSGTGAIEQRAGRALDRRITPARSGYCWPLGRPRPSVERAHVPSCWPSAAISRMHGSRVGPCRYCWSCSPTPHPMATPCCPTTMSGSMSRRPWSLCRSRLISGTSSWRNERWSSRQRADVGRQHR